MRKLQEMVGNFQVGQTNNNWPIPIICGRGTKWWWKSSTCGINPYAIRISSLIATIHKGIGSNPFCMHETVFH